MFSFWQRSDEPPNEKLLHAFEMSETDLEANRNGQLTSQQIKAAKRRNLWHFALETVPLLGVCVVLGTMFMAPSVGSFRVITIGIILAIILWLIRGQIRFAQDCRQGSVATVEGQIQRKSRRSGYTIVVYPSGLRFSVFSQVYGAFRSGQYYTLYHLPRSKRLIAAEHIPTDPI